MRERENARHSNGRPAGAQPPACYPTWIAGKGEYKSLHFLQDAVASSGCAPLGRPITHPQPANLAKALMKWTRPVRISSHQPQ
jgi:hypothetical protein